MNNANLRKALEAVGERCDEIIAVADDDSKKLSDLFSFRESNRSIDLCLALADALGRASAKDIRAEKALIESVHERIMLANSAIEDHAAANPLVMSAVRCVQQLAHDSLFGADGEIGNFTEIAAFLARHTVVTRTVFNALTTVLRRQLKKSEKAKSEAKGKGEGEGGRGPQTPFKRKQRAVFAKFLENHPVTPSVCARTRARQCWLGHKTEWDKAAEMKVGYSGYKELARAFLVQ